MNEKIRKRVSNILKSILMIVLFFNGFIWDLNILQLLITGSIVLSILMVWLVKVYNEDKQEKQECYEYQIDEE